MADHDREAFSCGAPELDHYLRHQARQDSKRRVAAPFVAIDQAGTIAGYYTLSAYTIRPGELSDDFVKRLPKYPLLSATLLGRLAVSEAYRGQGLGQFLLMDALVRSLRNTAEIASAGVVAEALDETARSFYLRHEFISLADQPRKLFIAMKTIERLSLR